MPREGCAEESGRMDRGDVLILRTVLSVFGRDTSTSVQYHLVDRLRLPALEKRRPAPV